MRKIYSAFRIFVHIVIFSIIAIYTLGYILLSIPNIQDKVRHIGIKELSALLDTNITIDRIQISPFNKLELFGAYIPDLNGDTLLYANKISAGISLSDLLVDRELVFTNIQLFGLDARITKETPSSETNLQFIIDAFKSNKNKFQNKQCDHTPWKNQIRHIIRTHTTRTIRPEPYRFEKLIVKTIYQSTIGRLSKYLHQAIGIRRAIGFFFKSSTI